MTDQRRINERIESLQELRNVVRAMRGMAATRVEEGQSALNGIRNHSKIVEVAISSAARLMDSGGPVDQDASEMALLVIIASEHGFVGSFNENLIDRAERILRPDLRIGIVGRRGVTALAERGIESVWKLPGASSVAGTEEVARSVAAASLDFGKIDLLYPRYQSGGRYAIEVKPVLPLPPGLLEIRGDELPPLHHLSPRRLLVALAGEYLFSELALATIESFVSENAARLAMMQVGDSNISDKLDNLRQKERTMRQEAITLELMEIVTGEEALFKNQGLF